MARGWESKSVESQIESAEDRKRPVDHRTPEQQARDTKLEGLRLQRKRVAYDLENSKSERYRQTLGQALAWLEAEIAKLTAEAD